MSANSLETMNDVANIMESLPRSGIRDLIRLEKSEFTRDFFGLLIWDN